MSSPEFQSQNTVTHEQLSAAAVDFFDDVYDSSVHMRVFEPGENEQHDNLVPKGYGLAEMYDPHSDKRFWATFAYMETPYTRKIERIWDLELEGILTAGSHDKAIDDLVANTFDENWSHIF